MNGIGFQTSLLLTRNGYCTCARMRDPMKVDLMKKIAGKEQLLEWTLPLKVIPMGGYGLFGVREDLPIEDINDEFYSKKTMALN